VPSETINDYKATGFSTHSASDVAGLVLATPAQKLVTDASGYVTANLNGDFTSSMKGSLNTSTPASVTTVTGNVNGSVDSVTDGVIVTTNNDKVGYTLLPTTETQIDNIEAYASGVYTKIPSKVYLTGTDNSDGSIEMDDATGNYPGIVATVTNLTNAPTVGDFTAAMKSSITAIVPTASGIADQVWDEIVGIHYIVGSTGAALSAAGGSGDPWSTLIPGGYGDGTAGKIIGNNLNVPVDEAVLSDVSVSGIIDSIKDRVIDGSITFQKAITLRLAKDAGKVVVDGNTFKYYDQAGNLILTDPIVEGGSTRVIT